MASQRLLCVIACFHLLLVAMGASYFPFDKLGTFGQALLMYGSATGAVNSFGFFVTTAEDHIYAHFEIVDADGHQQPVALETGNSHEADLRIRGIADNFYMPDHDAARFQRSLAASLAGTVFGRYPQAAQVIVKLDKFTTVSMASYQAGERPRWDNVYEVRFAPGGLP